MPVDDGELRSALEHVLGRRVRALARRTHPYASSHAIEELEVTFEHGAPLALVFKDVTAPGAGARGAKPARLLDRDREIAAYRDVLAPAGLDVPACYGALARGARRWLFLEAVDGVPLWQVAGTDAWDDTARWLAGLHGPAAPARAAAPLLRYDAGYLHGWLARATALTPPGVLEGVAAVWERVVRCLAAWPCSVVHGDFYPSNVLVQEAPGGARRIRPVDWELAGIGPGLLDLAALTSGSWGASERERVALAYHGALPAPARPARADLLDALAVCRLFLAVQWLGWSGSWTPPAEHAHDWLAEATALAGEIAR